MHRLLGPLSSYTYALLRIVAGFLFAQHGAQKILGLLLAEGQSTRPFLSQLWFAGVIEFFGGVLIALGAFTGWVAFIASGQMAVAYFQAHAPRGFWPILNAGELAVLYCFVFFFIASRGSGVLSVDALFRRR